MSIVLSALLSLLLFTSCDSKKAFDSTKVFKTGSKEKLMIIDYGPKGLTEGDVSQIRLTFNKRMRILGEKKDVSALFSISPKVDCDYKWVSETSVVCQVKGKLKRATEYKVDFVKGISSKDGIKSLENFSYSFKTTPPILLRKYIYFEKEVPFGKAEFDLPIVETYLKGNLKCKGALYEATLSKDKTANSYLLTVDPKELVFPLLDCEFSLKGKLATTEGPIQSDLDVKMKVYKGKSGLEDKDRLISYFKNINCNGGYWYNDQVTKSKACVIGSPINFRFHSGSGNSIAVETIPPVSNLTSKFNWGTYAITGDFEAGKIYDFKFKVSGAKEVVASIEFVNKPPNASLRYRNVIIEKTGPHQIPLQAMNINSFDVNYIQLTELKDIVEAAFNSKDYGDFNNASLATSPAKEVLAPSAKLDNGVIFPIEVDQFSGKNSSGLYQLRFNSKDVKPEAQSAYKKIREGRTNSYQNKSLTYNFEGKIQAQITNIGMHVKQGYLNSLVWVYDIPSGLPLANTEVYAYSDLQSFKSLKTDGNGLAIFEGKNHSVFVAKTADDISFVSSKGYFAKGISPWAFNVEFSETTDRSNFVIESIPDRPIYKAGEKVSLKIFVREWDLHKLTYIPNKEKNFDVLIRNSRGEKVHTEKLKLNEFSTTSLSFDLAKDAKLGDYQVSVTPDDGATVYIKGFKVQEYKLSPFKVETSVDKKDYVVGEKLKLTGSASYFFGGAYKNAKGSIVANFKHKLYRPKNENYIQFRFHDSNNYGYYDYFYGGVNSSSMEIHRKELTTDKKGEFGATISTSQISSSYLKGTIEIMSVVEGESGQKIASVKASSFLNSTHILGARFDKWSYKDGSQISPKVVILDDKELIKEGLDLTYELFKVEYQTTRRLGSGNYFYYDSKKIETSLGKCQFKSNKDFKSCEILVKGNGSYYSKVSGKDSSGNSIHVINHTYVYGGEGYASWNSYNHDRIDLLPNKYNYKVGEKAEILIKSPFKETQALITVERYGVIKQEVITIKGNTHVYELPIDSSFYAPGIYVSAVLLKGRTEGKVEGSLDLGKPAFKMGYVKLGVKDTNLNLKVTSEASPKKLLPKEKVKLKFKVQDHTEKNKKFELAVAVVDEAVLQLVSSYKSRYQLFETFYSMPDLSVRNYQSLVNLLGRQTYGKKGGTPGGGGGAGEEGLREDFLAVAHWQPHLITNEDGEAEIEFEVPDNLTTWKVLVVANDKTRKFGLGVSDFMVTKDIIVEPVLPEFLTEGDELNSKMVVHNKTANEQKIMTSIEAKGFTPSTASKEITIKGNEKEKITYKLIAPTEGKYDIFLKAKSSSDSDIVKYVMDVLPIKTLFVDGLFGHTVESKISMPFMLPKDIKAGSQKLDIKVSSTVLAGMRDSFEYVLKYPYGCWEQRMSKALYLAFYDKLRPVVGTIGDGFPLAKSKIQELLDMAPQYMDESGGMKYYPSQYGHASPYLSTFTAMAFQILDELGYKIPQTSKGKLGKYLKSIVNGGYSWNNWYKPHTILNNEAMVVNILDKWGETGLDGSITNLVSKYSALPLFGKSFLIDLMNRKDKYKQKAKGHLSNLLSNMDVSAGKAQFVTNQSYFSPYFLDTNTRSQCAMLGTLLEVDSANENVAKIQNHISSMRKGGRWYNTQENFFCFYSMYKYSQIYEKDAPDFSVATVFNKEVKNTSKLDLATTQNEFEVDIKSITAGKESKVEFQKTGDGRLYYFAWLKYAKAKLPSKRVNQGFNLEKQMFKFNEATSEWTELGQSMKLKIGDILKIRIKVDTKGNRTHIGLNDPLAACFTPINTALATTANNSKAFTTKLPSTISFEKNGEFSWNSAFRFMDMRKTAIQFYSPKMRPGTFGVEYDVRVTASGKFTQNAPSVEEMYFPDVRGTGLGRNIVVED